MAGIGGFRTNHALCFGIVVVLLGPQVAPGNVDPAARPARKPAFVNTADPAVSGAQEVVLDLPSALHWSRYQQGAIGLGAMRFFLTGPHGSRARGARRGRGRAVL